MQKGMKLKFKAEYDDIKSKFENKDIYKKEIKLDSEFYNENVTDVVQAFIQFVTNTGVPIEVLANIVPSFFTAIRHELLSDISDSDIRNTEDYAKFTINKENFLKKINEDERFLFHIYGVCEPIFHQLNFYEEDNTNFDYQEGD